MFHWHKSICALRSVIVIHKIHGQALFQIESGDDRLQRRNGSSIAMTIRPQGDYLSYKVLGDKVLGFVRARGSLKVFPLLLFFRLPVSGFIFAYKVLL